MKANPYNSMSARVLSCIKLTSTVVTAGSILASAVLFLRFVLSLYFTPTSLSRRNWPKPCTEVRNIQVFQRRNFPT